MKIDFDKIEEITQPHFNGGEKDTVLKMFSDRHNRILMGKLIPGASVGLHSHMTDCEIIYVVSGTGKAIENGELERVAPGSVHYCPKGHSHSLINDGTVDLVFFAVVPSV